MKHFAVISTSFPDLVPGSEAAGSFVADFAETLSRFGRVSVIAPSRETREEMLSPTLKIYRFSVPCLPLSLLSPLNPRHWPAVLRTLRAGRRTAAQIIRAEAVDHILACWAFPSGYWARCAGKNRGIPFSVWALGSDIWSLGKLPVAKNVIRTILKDSHSLFADGLLLQNDVASLAGRPCAFLPSSRRLTISRKRQFSEGPPYRLAYLGRWHYNKGVDLLLASLGLLNDEDWDCIAEVRICGGGPMENGVIKGCQALKRAGRPVFPGGFLNKQEATELLMWTDYLLIPSRIESIPVVFSDAMQAHCPVVAAPVGDLPRLLSSYRVGVLSEETGASAFAAAIRRACKQTPGTIGADLEAAAQAFDVTTSVRTFLSKIGRFSQAEYRL